MSATSVAQSPDSDSTKSSASSNASVASKDSQGEAHRWNSRQGVGLVRQLVNAGHFLRDLRVHMRFGELTRAPLNLMRLEIRDGTVACDWIARLPDPWDISLPRHLQQRHASLQTLRDAIDVRDLLFHTLPNIKTAEFRVYRLCVDQEREMVLAGSSERGDNFLRRVRSVSMQAKLLGFQFSLENGVLHRLSGDEAPRSSGIASSVDPFPAT